MWPCQSYQTRQCIAAKPIPGYSWIAAFLTINIGACHQPGQILVANFVLAEQHQTGRLYLVPGLVYQQINPDNRFDTRRTRSLVELDHRKQIALVCKGHSGHSGIRRCLHQTQYSQFTLFVTFTLNTNHAIQQ